MGGRMTLLGTGRVTSETTMQAVWPARTSFASGGTVDGVEDGGEHGGVGIGDGRVGLGVRTVASSGTCEVDVGVAVGEGDASCRQGSAGGWWSGGPGGWPRRGRQEPGERLV